MAVREYPRDSRVLRIAVSETVFRELENLTLATGCGDHDFYYRPTVPQCGWVIRVRDEKCFPAYSSSLQLSSHLVKNYMGVNPDAYTTAIDLSNVSSS